MPTITRPPRFTPAQTLAPAAILALPAVAQGLIMRRPLAVRLAGLADAAYRSPALLACGLRFTLKPAER
ncbi:hypothetical protein [Nonomuraea basaltis]|uniref:hypothetical protein n=1 Tax=Nonomuraea basaltis TaxID=2495887 RepID=UPI00110C4D3E|nr:hypothetical protein [Nonomuraea basaltis]TMR98509.1 hypothetical protein EJK15_12195 [Nonomuraea basaltis]